MPISVTVLYPSDAKFDLNYYNEKHMAMVQEKWHGSGLQSWNVAKLESGAPYQAVARLYWGSRQQWDDAMEQDGKELMDDVKNFSDKPALIMVGDTVKQS